MLQSSAVQTFIAKSITQNLENVLDGHIEIGKIHFRPFHTLLLKDIALIDAHPYEDEHCERVDTLFSAHSISATFNLKGLLKGEILHFDNAHIIDGSMFLVTEPMGKDETLLNLNRIFKLKKKEQTVADTSLSNPQERTNAQEEASPSTEKPKKEPKDLFEIRQVKLDNFRFRMRNYNALAMAYDPERLDRCITKKEMSEAAHLKWKQGSLSDEEYRQICQQIHTAEMAGPGKLALENLDGWMSRREQEALSRQIRHLKGNYHKNHLPVAGSISWIDLDVYDIDLKGHDLSMKKGIVAGVAESMSFKEKSGYEVYQLCGHAHVGNGKTSIDQLQIHDLHSDLYLPNLTFRYENTKSWSYFEDEVEIDGVIAKPTILDMQSIGYFAHAVKPMTFHAALEGSVLGIVNDLDVNHLHFKTIGSQMEGTLDGLLSNVTSSGNMYMNVKAENLSFDAKGLGDFIRSWAPQVKMDLSNFAKGQRISLNARVRGILDNFNVDGRINHYDGRIYTDIDIKNVTKKYVPILIEGGLNSEELDLGRLLGMNALGTVSLSTDLSAELGESPELKINSLNISKLNALDYDYTGIAANGIYSQNMFNGKVICNDPNLNFLFQGIFTNPSKKVSNSIYRFYANMGYADLQALNIDKRGVSRISFQTNTNFNHVKDGNILGQITINDFTLEDDEGFHKIGDINIASHVNNNLNRIKLTSKFAEGYFVGTAFLDEFIKDLQSVTTGRELPALQHQQLPDWKGNRYEAEIKFHDSSDLLSYLVPGIYVADSTEIRLNIDETGYLETQLKSRRLAIKDKYLKGVQLKIENAAERLQGTLTADEISVSPILISNNQLDITAKDNRIGLGLKFDNEVQDTTKGNLHLVTDFSRSDQDSLLVHASLRPSKIYFKSSLWDLKPAQIFIGNDRVQIDDLNILHERQRINVHGGYSRTKTDTLQLNLEEFDMSLLNSFMKQDIQFQSSVSGYAKLISPSQHNFGILLNLQCDSTMMAGEKMGTVYLRSAWDEVDRSFKYLCSNDLEGKKSLEVRGNFRPKDKSIDAHAKLDRLNLAYARPFLASIFSDFSGALSGQIHAKGPVRNLALNGQDLRIDQGYLIVDFTKVPYYLDGPLIMSNDGLFFDNVALHDIYGAQGWASGGLLWKNLKDFSMDTHIRFNDIEALRTTAEDNPSFYGHVFGSGNVNITGPFSSLLLEVNAHTAKSGKIHIPLSNSPTSNTSNLLSFKEPEKEVYIDPYEVMMNKLKKKETAKTDLAVRLRLDVDSFTQASIEIDKASGNILNGWGNGYMDMDVRPSKDIFTINGEYQIVGGNYNFGAMGVLFRDFTLQPGGTVKFNGDIMDSDLDLTALYKTKTNLGILLADNNSMSRRQVECGIGISGKIKNPRINFTINVPDLDPTTQSRVESALSTEDKLQKQFLSLLLTNSFLPDEQSGIVNNNSLLYSNVTEIMSNQLNNILQKLDIPVDLGLDYQQSQDGNNAFDVAVSTELFNSRVLVNGTFGSRQYSQTGNTNEFVGDLDIEVKLDKSGAFRLNLFSHSADQYSSYLDNSQRSGIGLTYQHEFNTFKEFFKSLFKSKKKRAEEKKLQQNMVQLEPKVKIEILPENNEE